MQGIYEIDTKLDFGNYKGYDLGLVYVFNASYIDWCILNMANFCIKDLAQLEDIPVVNEKIGWIEQQNPEMTAGLNMFNSYREMSENVNLGRIKHKFSEEIVNKNNFKISKMTEPWD